MIIEAAGDSDSDSYVSTVGVNKASQCMDASYLYRLYSTGRH